MSEVPRRGRPPSGRKTVYQVALDDDPHGETIAKIAEAEGKSTSAVIRELVIEGLGRRRRNR
ncbi:ribbon-helix-helix protein, CopG family [Hyphomicrobium sp. MC1]|uniref:ribbon-helix-helix protein, CopG family n=1 Tax=Hyphomicrobium sp. (strain MC1) TaxID=717785 RepID=UPI000213EAD8|nr:conserved protein of unknown function [Hyphomicrobium sp. MC1]